MEAERSYQVYKHTNLTNGKVYIGATANDWQSRWSQGYKRNKRLRADMSETDETQWTHEALAVGLTREEAMKEESRQIKLHDATNPEKGYNVSYKSMILDDVARQKLSYAMKRRHESMSKEEREAFYKWQKSMSADERSALGKRGAESLRKHIEEDPEFARKLSEAARARSKAMWADPAYRASHTKPESEKKRYVPVPRELAHEHMSEARKKVWERPGYREAASERARLLMTEERRAMLAARQRGTTHSDEVIKKIAAKQRENWARGVNRASVASQPRTQEAKEKTSATLSARYGKPVYCIETDTTYPSIKEAARRTGCDADAIKKVVRGSQTQTRGYHFKPACDVTQESDHCIAVICVETGQTYSSMKEAAEAVGVKASGISLCCKGTRKICGGYHWRYADA